MGKKWDNFKKNLFAEQTETNKGQNFHTFWLAQAFRVMESGGVIKAFSASRTYHRLCAAMVAAGFVDVRVEAWTYASGFPKSLNISKALVKTKSDNPKIEREIQRVVKEQRLVLGLERHEVDDYVFGKDPKAVAEARYAKIEGRGGQKSEKIYIPTSQEWESLKEVLELDDQFDDYILSSESGYSVSKEDEELAEKYQGFGTALKPAFEPIVVGYKP